MALRRTPIRAHVALIGLALAMAAVVAVVGPAGAAANQPDRAWVRHVTTPSFDEINGVSVVGGSVYVGGLTGGGFNGPNLGSYDGFIRRLSTSGATVWSRQVGTPSTEYLYGVAGSKGAVYAAGSTQGTFAGQTSQGASDAFLVKYQKDGSFAWARQFGTATNDGANAVAVDATGVYVVGWTLGELPGKTSAGGQDAFVRKYDAAGNVLWTKQLGTSESDYADAVAVGNGGVYLAGDTNGTFPGKTNAGNADMYLTRYDRFGNGAWLRQLGSPEEDDAFGVAAVRGSVYLGGNVEGDMPGHGHSGMGDDVFVQRFAPGGGADWSRQVSTYDSSSEGLGITASLSGVHVVGYTGGEFPGQSSAGMDDTFIQRFRRSGTTSWSHQFGTAADDTGRAITDGPSGIYVAGITEGTFPGQPAVTTTDGFVARFDWFRPDGSISRKRSTGFIADDVYLSDATDQQTRVANVHEGDATNFYLRLENDGDTIDELEVKGCDGSSKLAVTYWRGSTDVTAGVTAGTYDAELAPGARSLLRMRTKVLAAASPGNVLECTVVVRSGSEGTQRDTLRSRVFVT